MPRIGSRIRAHSELIGKWAEEQIETIPAINTAGKLDLTSSKWALWSDFIKSPRNPTLSHLGGAGMQKTQLTDAEQFAIRPYSVIFWSPQHFFSRSLVTGNPKTDGRLPCPCCGLKEFVLSRGWNKAPRRVLNFAATSYMITVRYVCTACRGRSRLTNSSLPHLLYHAGAKADILSCGDRRQQGQNL